MARNGREEAQRRRAEARERRRKQSGGERNEEATAPSEEATAHSADGESAGTDRLDTVKQAAKVAAAGAAVGAAAAAARVLGKSDEERESADDAQAAHATAQVDEQQREREPDRAQAPEPEPQPEAEAQPEREPATGAESHDERPSGAPPTEAGETARQAREQLEALLGRRPESVSGMERTHDGWLVTVEVVEVSRIPESTDVLASYEIELDEDRNLRRYARVRRYHRSQADEGGAP
jgi:hypothetical protein